MEDQGNRDDGALQRSEICPSVYVSLVRVCRGLLSGMHCCLRPPPIDRDRHSFKYLMAELWVMGEECGNVRR